MTREELTDWWRLYVRTLAGLLEAAEGAPGAQPPPNVLQQVQQLQREALFLHIRCARVLAAAGCSVHGPQCCPTCSWTSCELLQRICKAPDLVPWRGGTKSCAVGRCMDSVSLACVHATLCC